VSRAACPRRAGAARGSLTVDPISAAEHLAFVRTQRSVSFLQKPAWGRVKTEWRSESLGRFDGRQLVGTGLVPVAVVPADIPEESRSPVREKAKTVYRALGCRGLSRVDMFLTEDGGVVLNKVNTFPGMTSYSRYPRMMAAGDLRLTDVIDRLLSLALTGKLR
jgi:hypothetical protein